MDTAAGRQSVLGPREGQVYAVDTQGYLPKNRLEFQPDVRPRPEQYPGPNHHIQLLEWCLRSLNCATINLFNTLAYMQITPKMDRNGTCIVGVRFE